jgi:hypothetical protein
LAVLSLLLLGGCSSIGDLGRLQPSLVSDDMHAWVGQEGAAKAGAPISLNSLTEEERTLRDLAFPLIAPPYDRQRWDEVLYEYGLKREFRRDIWVGDITAYYAHLQAAGFRSSVGRYNKLIDDIHSDTARIGPFFDLAHRVADLDRRRDESMHYLADLSPPDRLNAQARIGENTLTIAWVYRSLTQRCAGYRFALDHLVVAEPEKVAAQADLALTQLQQQIAAVSQTAPQPRIAAAPVDIAEQQAPITK